MTPALINPAITKVIEKWEDLLNNATERIVSSRFVEPLLEALGFDFSEYYPEFRTGNGAQKVDFAARKNKITEIKFFIDHKNPDLLIEVKGRQTSAGTVINLAEGTPQYKATKQQITKYLLAPKCQTAKWGLITNGNHIQLFRKHGKVVFPATANHFLKPNNIYQIIQEIKQLIDQPNKALSICVYNDKGGVGKTTTVVNLAAVLAKLGKKVLVVDFDPQQGDLTAALGKKQGKNKLSDCLVDHKILVEETIQTFVVNLAKDQRTIDFDIIPSDSGLETFMEPDQQAKIEGNFQRLKKLINPLSNQYDYIIFDCPTNWFFFSKSCVYASDVVLIPVQHDNFASLKNAKKVIEQYIPEIQNKKENGSPVALPVFFNNYRPTDASIKRTHKEIESLLDYGLNKDLVPYFYPNGDDNKQIRRVPQFAIIASAGFNRCPAALSHINAYKYYENLVSEYFGDIAIT